MKKLSWNQAQKELAKGNHFLMFSTTWCNDCKMMYPVVEKLQEVGKTQFPSVRFIEVDGEEANLYQSKNEKLKVLRVPSFYFVKNGVYNFIGYEYLPVEILKNAIKKRL